VFYYIHIPFCRQRCSYCRFALDPRPTDAKIAAYIGALLREIDTYMIEWGSQLIESIYFGGGTPSMLPLNYLEAILEKFPVGRRSLNCEVILEGNPEDFTRDTANAYKNLGFTRISLGVQTLSDAGLAEVGRVSHEVTLTALDHLTAAGHTNVNVDFMLGLPYVEAGETLSGIKTLCDRYPNITHTSIYLLEYEHTYPKSWQTLAISREEQYAEYGQISEYLGVRGFEHYEISNFGRAGYESRHNMAYWDHSETRGFGLSAASYTGGERYANASTFPAYYRGEVVDRERLTLEQVQLEKWMFGLRTFALDPALVRSPQFLQKSIDLGQLEYFSIGETLSGVQLQRVRPTTAWILQLDHIMQGLF
jgi:oxygen-independent coproporphyrinogen III oxidase